MTSPEKIMPRWLKKKPAAWYSAIGQRRLVELANDPDCPIIGFPDPDNGRGDYVFDRLSLDTYRLNQAGCQYTTDTAIGILNSVRGQI